MVAEISTRCAPPWPLQHSDVMDSTGDRRSGINDVMDVLSAFGMRLCGLVTDTNDDCSINVEDVRAALASFGCKCPVGRVIRKGRCEPCGPADIGQCCAAGVRWWLDRCVVPLPFRPCPK